MRGYKEEGTTTTPFDMAMLNGIDRFQLALDVLDRVPGLRRPHSTLRRSLQDRRVLARNHTASTAKIPTNTETGHWANTARGFQGGRRIWGGHR